PQPAAIARPGDSAAGAAGDYPPAGQPVSQSDQELQSGDWHWLRRYFYDGHDGDESIRPDDYRLYDRDAVLPAPQPGDFSGDELGQQPLPASNEVSLYDDDAGTPIRCGESGLLRRTGCQTTADAGCWPAGLDARNPVWFSPRYHPDHPRHAGCDRRSILVSDLGHRLSQLVCSHIQPAAVHDRAHHR